VKNRKEKKLSKSEQLADIKQGLNEKEKKNKSLELYFTTRNKKFDSAKKGL
jgi:hypothetical protein